MPEKRENESPRFRSEMIANPRLGAITHSSLMALGLTLLLHLTVQTVLLPLPELSAIIESNSLAVFVTYAVFCLTLSYLFFKGELRKQLAETDNQARLRRSERQNRRMLELLGAIPEAVIMIDQYHKVIYLNHPAENLTGWGMPYITGRTTEEIVRLTDRTGRPIDISDITDGRSPYYRKGCIVNRAGQKTPVETSLTEIIDDTGAPLGAILIFRDLSNDSSYSEAVDFAGIGIMKYTIDGTVKDIDTQALRILDLDSKYPDAATVIGQKLTELTVYSKAFRKVQREILRRGDIRGMEYQVVTLKGKPKWLLHDSRIEIDRESGEKVIRAIIRDITLRKTAQHDSEEKRFYLDGILKSTVKTSIIATDTIFRIKYFNQAAEKLFGCKGRDIIGKGLMDLHRRDKLDPTAFDQARETILMNGEYVYRIKRELDGRKRQFEFTIRGLRRENGRLAGYVVIAHETPDKPIGKIELKRGEESAEKSASLRYRETTEVIKSLL